MVTLAKHHLAIIDSDQRYVIKLMEFINQMKDTLFSVSAFTQISGYISYAAEHKVDVLICSGDIINEVILEVHESQKNIIMLSKTIQNNNTEYPCIYKYQSAANIYSEILSLCGIFKKDDKAEIQYQEKDIIGIIPLFSGELCFYFGVLLADYYGSSQKALYISFDPVFSPKLFQNLDICMSVTEGICSINGENESAAGQLDKLLLSEKKFDILGGCSHWADCTEVTEEEAVLLIEKLIKIKSYRKIIIDFGGLYRMTDGLIKFCDRIYIPKPENVYELERLGVCKRQAGLNGSSIDDRAVYVSFSEIKDSRVILSSCNTVISGRKSRINYEEASSYNLSRLRESILYDIVKKTAECQQIMK